MKEKIRANCKEFRRKWFILTVQLILGLLILLTTGISTGCWSKYKLSGPESGPPSQSVPPAAEIGRGTESDVVVYYVKVTESNAYLVREVHRVITGGNRYAAAVQELVGGRPQTPGAVQVFPAGTRVLGVEVKEGLATVNFSAEVLQGNAGAAVEGLALQSLANTLTEFPEIKAVALQVEGKVDERVKNWWGHVGLYEQPFKRNLDVVWEPAIWVNKPHPGEAVTSPLTVEGSARVFEGTVNLRLRDSTGQVLVEDFTTALMGAPGRGDFKKELRFVPPAAGEGVLEVFWYSPKDGRELDKVTVPLTFSQPAAKGAAAPAGKQ